MKHVCGLIFVLLLLLTPCIADASDADGDCFLRISAVYPCNAFEGFALINYGPPVDLIDYHVSDGEGNVTFSEHYVLDTCCTVYVFKSEPAEWFSFEGGCLIVGTNGVSAKGFALNDSGDDIYLMRGDTVIDSFVYGSGTAKFGGWNGDAFQKISKKNVAVRKPFADTDSAADWALKVPGRTSVQQSDVFDAEVVPFVFPDSAGEPVIQAIQRTEERIDISVYMLSHPDIVSSLMSLLKTGRTVRILAEGSPAGGISEEEIKAFRTLSEAGADVRLMSQIDGFRRYPYLHCKYAVIDDGTVIITSENWLEQSFQSNRGWGAIIMSEGCARYMEDIFESDFDCGSKDIRTFDSLYPTSKRGSYPAPKRIDTVYESYRARVSMSVSPDNSMDSMKEFLSGVSERIYSEQLEVQYYWAFGNDNPVSWMLDASKTGADCRLMVDTTFDDQNDDDYEDGYGVIEWLTGTSLYAKSSDFPGLTHNKGVIADDAVWVGSVNWTDNSFCQNRECAAVIVSEGISDFYAGYFLKDWGTMYSGRTVLRISGGDDAHSGETFILDASGSTVADGSEFSWDTDGDGIADRFGPRVAVELPPGIHRVTLFADDGDTVSAESKDIFVTPASETANIPAKYIPLIAICLFAVCAKAVHAFRGRGRDDKGHVRKRS